MVYGHPEEYQGEKSADRRRGEYTLPGTRIQKSAIIVGESRTGRFCQNKLHVLARHAWFADPVVVADATLQRPTHIGS